MPCILCFCRHHQAFQENWFSFIFHLSKIRICHHEKCFSSGPISVFGPHTEKGVNASLIVRNQGSWHIIRVIQGFQGSFKPVQSCHLYFRGNVDRSLTGRHDSYILPSSLGPKLRYYVVVKGQKDCKQILTDRTGLQVQGFGQIRNISSLIPMNYPQRSKTAVWDGCQWSGETDQCFTSETKTMSAGPINKRGPPGPCITGLNAISATQQE